MRTGHGTDEATAMTPAASSPQPAQALVLDFGGVVTRTLFETHEQTESALGLPAGSMTWRGPFDPANDALWQRMQRDEISERDYWLARSREVGALLGETWDDMQTLVRRARGSDPEGMLRPETLALIEAAHAAGHRLALLSNELDLFYGTEMRERLRCLEHFDVIVDATYTGILKPDRRAYDQVLSGLGVPANACVFVDDQQRNIDGARAAGMQVVWFDVLAPQRSCDEAAQRLGLPLAAPPPTFK